MSFRQNGKVALNCKTKSFKQAIKSAFHIKDKKTKTWRT